MQKKNNSAFSWGNMRRSLFPIRNNWRFWVAAFGPVPFAFWWPFVIEPNLVNSLLIVTFYLTVVRAFTRYMLKGQFRADRLRRAKWRAEVSDEIQRLEREYLEILAMLEQLPPDVRAGYEVRANDYASKLSTLNRLLEGLPE